jgi:hypothetical protein
MASPYQIKNPLGVDSLQGLFDIISGRFLEIVIPIAVLMYVWAGVNYLVAAGRTEYITRAKTTFKYTTYGLVIIFIGGGFVNLIQSIINAGQ